MQQMFRALEMLKYVLSMEGVVTQTQDPRREEKGGVLWLSQAFSG